MIHLAPSARGLARGRRRRSRLQAAMAISSNPLSSTRKSRQTALGSPHSQVRLALDVGLARLPLGVEGIEILLEPLLGRRPPIPILGGEPTYRGRAANSRNRLETGRSALRVPPDYRPERPYAKGSISASASAISGISGVGEKPLSAGASTAPASAGRPVD
jgi:hypothetical protein